jgi:site-specific recombinase XerD
MSCAHTKTGAVGTLGLQAGEDVNVQENQLLPPTSSPLGPEVFELWFNNRANDDRDWLTPKGAVLYRLIWKRWLISLGQHSNIDGQVMSATAWHKATAVDVNNFINGNIRASKKQGKVSPITRRRYWSAIDRIYRFALSHQWVTENPALGLLGEDMPPSEDPKGAVLTDALWKAAFTAFPVGDDLIEKRNRAVLMTIFHLGLAPREIRQLTVQDVLIEGDEDSRKVVTHDRITALRVENETRGDHRVVHVPASAAKALGEWLSARQSYKPAQNHDVLFCSRKSPSMSMHALLYLVTKTIRTACQISNLPLPARLGPQVVRNTVLVRWLNGDFTVEQVVKAAGLKNVKGLYHLRDLVHHEVRLAISKHVHDEIG